MVTKDDVDWFNSEEARRDHGVTPEEAAAMEKLYQSAVAAGGEVRRAFAGVSLRDGIGLREADGMDDHRSERELSALRETDEREDWSKISFDDLHRHAAGWWYMNAAGLLFHTPAFILADLADESDWVMPFRLTTPSDKLDLLLNVLSRDQKQAVRMFLTHCLQDEFHQSVHDAIRTSLDEIWSP